MNKREQFKEAAIQFELSARAPEDYMAFLIVARRVLQQGDGLSWNDIQEVLNEVLI